MIEFVRGVCDICGLLSIVLVCMCVRVIVRACVSTINCRYAHVLS